MNKKFLSAILFGALMATSAGTFVSCKDYDDDINNLQTQIDKNSSAIAELQKLVGAGKWVTSISSIENGFTVTMSDGSSHQIKGIKGKDGVDGQDGKNGTVWTIGEDGFWYVDGEKTENVAVAKDGKDGVSAPAPTISADGNWVLYTWDAEKGEFVAEETEIPAAGESAYVVKANGVYELHIADANGAFQTIALPATSDSFVVEAPYKEVDVTFEIATWKKWAANSKTDAGKALLAKYPELAEIEKNAPMKQGGMLPVLATPANVDLSEGFSFQLVDIYGKVAEIELSDATKGANLSWLGDKLVSRSAEDACLWSLAVEPAYDAKKKTYASAYRTSLVAKNAKGTIVRTAFAYTLAPFNYDDYSYVDVEINTNNGAWSESTGREGLGSKAPYAEAIDLFAGVVDANGDVTYPISFNHAYNNHYIIVLNDALQAEKYGLSIAEDGHTLNIAKMPETDLSIEVELKVIALGLNGSIDEEIVKLYVGQEIAATAPLAEKNVTLSYDKKNKSYEQIVAWNIADLKFNATQLDQFLKAAKTLKWSYVDVDGNEHKNLTPITVNAYDKDGNVTTSYKNAVTFGFVLDANDYVPAVYDIRLEATTEGGNTVIYAAETTMTVKNPELTAIKLIAEYVENGVLQAVGEPKANGKIEYDFLQGLILADEAIVSNVTFTDIARAEYEEINGEDAAEDDEVMESVDWITDNKLVINAYDAEEAEEDPAHYNQLNQVRKIRATFNLFGNENNIDTFDFEVKVKSAVYSETPAEVVTITPAGLALKLYNNPATTAVDNVIDIKTITTAVLAYGPNAGKKYTLWDTPATPETTGTKTHNKYGSWKTIQDKNRVSYVANSNNLLVAINAEDLAAFGYTASEIIQLQTSNTSAYILATGNYGESKTTWYTIWNSIKDLKANVKVSATEYEVQNVFVKVKKQGSKTEFVANDVVELNTAAYNAYLKDNANKSEATYLKLWNKYHSSIAYDTVEETYTIAAVPASGRSAYLTEDAKIEMVDEEVGENFVTFNGTTITAGLANGVDMTTDEVEVEFNLVISDVWGMTMKVPFTITVSK